MSDDAARLVAAVSRKTLRKLRAGTTAHPPLGFGLGMFGVVGWSVSVPALLGTLLGTWLDKHHPGAHSWTLALLVAGLMLGCANAGYWIFAQVTDIGRETGDDE